MSRARTVAIVVTPLVAMATLVFGLRVGARDAVHAATIYAAPAAAGSRVAAWQIVTYLDDRGVKEAVPIAHLSARARSAEGKELAWTGSSNGDGVAEMELDAVPVEIMVRDDATGEVLAKGRVEEPPLMPPATPSHGWVRPSKLEGDLAISVAVEDERLTPGYPGTLYVRVTDRTTGVPASATVDPSPEPGLLAATSSMTTCANGWAELAATPQIHVVGLGLRARAPDGRTGEWYGSLPIAPGAIFAGLPRRIGVHAPAKIEVFAPNARTIAYVEIDDAVGRVHAAALPLRPDSTGVPRALFEVPGLEPGLHWLVVSGEPRGAESIGGATVARTFLVGDGYAGACELGPYLAQHSGGGVHKWVGLEGLAGRRAKDRHNQRLGLGIALASLAIAALLEVLLVLRGASEVKDDLSRALLDEDDADGAAARVTHRTSAGSVIIGVLVAMLGFALVAAMLVWKAN